jgi:tetratricopeptide (TPR) repeat protein
MSGPDWRNLALLEGILLEQVRDDNRMVFWLPTERDRQFQYWERVGTVPRAEIRVEQGICTLPATSVRARQRLGESLLGKLARKLKGAADEETWILPSGQPAEKCGDRVTGLALVWPDDSSGSLDESSARAVWPGLTRCQAIGDRLLLVAGSEAAPASSQLPQSPDAAGGTEELGCPVALAEQLLEAARQTGDRARETAALVDLGVVTMNEGDLRKAVTHLDKALSLARELNDREREIDALNNLGYALLAVGQAPTARRALEAALVLARQVGDPYAEKLIVERLGTAHANMRDAAGALKLAAEALEMTRAKGDRQQETRVLWNMAIAHADLNQRDQAIARAQESIDLLRKLGKPEASWYGAQLQRYRVDFAGLGSGSPGSGGAIMTGGPMGASVMTAAQPVSDPNTGPGLLRMAVSATKAMMKFIGSGLKKTAPQLQLARMSICQSCAHHTGLRCRICGCFTNVKTRMAHEQCPIGKWPA